MDVRRPQTSCTIRNSAGRCTHRELARKFSPDHDRQSDINHVAPRHEPVELPKCCLSDFHLDIRRLDFKVSLFDYGEVAASSLERNGVPPNGCAWTSREGGVDCDHRRGRCHGVRTGAQGGG